MGRKLFCEISPAAYQISLQKEILLRHLKNLFSREAVAVTRSGTPLPCLVKSHSSILLRRLEGVDMRLQENKVTNIRLACGKVNGIVIRPGETFSFWQTVGKTTAKKGYREGLVIGTGTLKSGIGGGMCQMANLIHWLVLNSPMDVTELHHHTDALFPDERRRVPFGTGTSICYNNIDYRFRNNTGSAVQLLTWVEDGELCGELRSETEFPYRYKIVEENHHFRKEGNEYFRVSQVYRLVIDKQTGEQLRKELLLDNHSKVMYDHSLIPEDQIRNGDAE